VSEDANLKEREEALRQRLVTWAALTPEERLDARVKRLRLWKRLEEEATGVCSREAGLPGDWDIPCRPDVEFKEVD